MRLLKPICLPVIQLAKVAWRLPRSVAVAFQHWRQRIARNELEAERLDRIRNPSKYRGEG